MRPENPLIVQSAHTIPVEVASPRYGEARDALLSFAELVKSPEHVHTYRITPLSVWNARAAGAEGGAIVRALPGAGTARATRRRAFRSSGRRRWTVVTRSWFGGATGVLLAAAAAAPATAQEPAAWGNEAEPVFHTFSIVAVDPATGETGVAVTTRNPCVGNAVPWVRPGVGAVATQGGTRIEYGSDLLDLLEQGVSPQEALDRVVAADEGRERRQVGVIGIDGRSAQWTGSGQYGAEAQGDWVAERAGGTYAVQGNSLVGTEVVDAVAEAFEASEGRPRHLADRLIEALHAGQVLGGDGRHGETQSAAVLVADPRPGMARRPDGISVNINVCEHPHPIVEMRRIYDTVSETLGFRTLEQPIGRDIVQLKMMLNALGYFRVEDPGFSADPEGTEDAAVYTQEAVDAVDRFRADQGWQTTVPGYVDARTIERLWIRLEEAGLADEIRERLLEIARVRR